MIAWATAGNPQIGKTEFGDWIKQYERTDSTTWEASIAEAANEYARLNRIRREIGVVAGEDVDNPAFIRDNQCDTLICGWLNGKSGAYFVGRKGTFSHIDTVGGFLTTGTGAPFADAVDVTQHYYGKRLDLTDESRFVNLMELTSRHAPQCSLPYEVVKISSGEVKRYKSKEPEPGVERTTPASQSSKDNNGE